MSTPHTITPPLSDLPKVHCSECGETQQLTIHAQVGLARVVCLVCRTTSFIQDPLEPDNEGSDR